MGSSRTVRRLMGPLLEQGAAYGMTVEWFAAMCACTQRFRS